ncbi:fibrobacter succinogenes major paralogous domain-containing protein [Candidatus Saccharibacteria bacterium]|nr:fibrobacter succinogenes major paralogous domain-containing protein [Candidatus Saccharibacteria bacterium]
MPNEKLGKLRQVLRSAYKNNRRNKNVGKRLGTFIGVFLLGLLSFSFAAIPAHADTNVFGNNKSKVSVTITDSLALRLLDKTASTEISSLNLALDLYPQGALTYDSMLAEVDTSNATGYKLYINSDYQDYTSSYTTSLTNLDSTIAEKSHGRIPTLSNPSAPTDLSFTITEAEYSIPNSAYRNTWGYSTNKLGIVRTVDEETSEVTNTITTNTDTSTVLYRPVPAHDNSISITESREPIIKHLTPITIGVNASAGTAAGTYRNKVALTAVANPLTIDYSLSFNGNTDGAGNNDGTATNLPETMTKSSVASQEEFVIPNTIPTRSGYVFMGWSEDPSINSGSGSGTDGLYIAGDTYTIIADDSDEESTTKTLYARWTTPPAFFTITYMQDMTPSVCSSATTPATSATTSDTTGAYDKDTSYVPETTLIDYRGTDGTGTASSPATGSNIRSYTVRKLADGNCWMAENLKLTLTNNQPVLVGTFSGGETSWTPTGDSAGNNFNANTKSNISVDGRNEWYYPWYAATAGQGTNTASPTISQSICPKGWKLPDSGGSITPSFQSIINEYSATAATTLEAFPLEYVASGRYGAGNLTNQSAGYYWSSNPYTSDSNYAYNLLFSGSTGPQNYSIKYYGLSVRCVAIP